MAAGSATQAGAVSATVMRLEAPTEEIRLLQLRLAHSMAFQPGQYVKLAFEGHEPRDYSIAADPGSTGASDILEFHIRDMGYGPSQHAVRQLKPGDAVQVTGPFGQAALAEAMTGPVLAVAGGTGLAPLYAIALAALRRDPARPVALYHGARDPGQFYLAERLVALAQASSAFRYAPVVGDEVGARAAADPLVGQAGLHVFLAGPPPMVEDASQRLVGAGIDEGAIRADPYHGDADQKRLIAEGKISL